MQKLNNLSFSRIYINTSFIENLAGTHSEGMWDKMNGIWGFLDAIWAASDATWAGPDAT